MRISFQRRKAITPLMLIWFSEYYDGNAMQFIMSNTSPLLSNTSPLLSNTSPLLLPARLPRPPTLSASFCLRHRLMHIQFAGKETVNNDITQV